MRRVLICGDRNWRNEEVIAAFVARLPIGALVIHGGCQGADLIAGGAALARGLPTIRMDAPWQAFGKRAGPVRNQWMLDYAQPDEVHAFHDNIAQSRGTADMVARARRYGMPVAIHTSSPLPASDPSTPEGA
jgi:hypothetical protein